MRTFSEKGETGNKTVYIVVHYPPARPDSVHTVCWLSQTKVSNQFIPTRCVDITPCSGRCWWWRPSSSSRPTSPSSRATTPRTSCRRQPGHSLGESSVPVWRHSCVLLPPQRTSRLIDTINLLNMSLSSSLRKDENNCANYKINKGLENALLCFL